MFFLQIIQRAGEFVVGAPGVFHMGYNLGSNCSEAVNFVSADFPKLSILYQNCDQ